MQHFRPNSQRRLTLYAYSRHPIIQEPLPAHLILENTRILLANETSWVQCHFIWPPHQERFVPVPPIAFCLLGAWDHSIGTDREENARSLLIIDSLIPPSEARGHKHITRWNDDKSRTHAEVLDLLDRAIARLSTGDEGRG